jgi:aminoglycoside 2''-phosphotransferase
MDTLTYHLIATFPDAPIEPPLSLLGTGFSSVVVETANGLVFRIPKTSAAGRAYLHECQCLPMLQSRLPVAVPQPEWYSAPNVYFPHGVMGYRKLKGHIFTPDDPMNHAPLIEGLAVFMAAMHRIPGSDLPSTSTPTQAEQYTIEREDLLPALRDAFSPGKYHVLLRWWDDFLHDQEVFTYQPTLRHGDLWYENILLDPVTHQLVGVLDFEDMACDDVAQDFAVQRYWGEAFYQRLLSAYRRHGGVIDAHLLYRIDRLWQVREFEEFHYALHHAPTQLPAAITKIQNSPFLNL